MVTGVIGRVSTIGEYCLSHQLFIQSPHLFNFIVDKGVGAVISQFAFIDAVITIYIFKGCVCPPLGRNVNLHSVIETTSYRHAEVYGIPITYILVTTMKFTYRQLFRTIFLWVVVVLLEPECANWHVHKEMAKASRKANGIYTNLLVAGESILGVRRQLLRYEM